MEESFIPPMLETPTYICELDSHEPCMPYRDDWQYISKSNTEALYFSPAVSAGNSFLGSLETSLEDWWDTDIEIGPNQYNALNEIEVYVYDPETLEGVDTLYLDFAEDGQPTLVTEDGTPYMMNPEYYYGIVNHGEEHHLDSVLEQTGITDVTEDCSPPLNDDWEYSPFDDLEGDFELYQG
ncbi:hypothetical protein GF362_02455 [Candidatus Dojkabacteria bacterium]|nr:hypothetical protein [Candidatus Dojkabacteria bacterium]